MLKKRDRYASANCIKNAPLFVVMRWECALCKANYASSLATLSTFELLIQTYLSLFRRKTASLQLSYQLITFISLSIDIFNS